MKQPLVKIQDLYKDYSLPKRYLFQKALVFRALHGINLELQKGENFGIVGESGCGKSTLARIVMALDEPTAGTVFFEGENIFKISAARLKHARHNFQMVFQDPYGSLNPRKNILKIVCEPLETLREKVSTAQRKERVGQILTEVGLNASDMDKFPHEFSGGQRQRIAIARALITRPSLIVADESVSALDVSVQAQVLNLMMDLQEKYNLTYMFISHDLSVVEYITDKVAVIYMGQIVEQGTTKSLFNTPLHPYTRTLLRAVPDVNPLNKKKKNKAIIPLFEKTDASCSFLDRCNRATAACVKNMPKLLENQGHLVACFNAG